MDKKKLPKLNAAPYLRSNLHVHTRFNVHCGPHCNLFAMRNYLYFFFFVWCPTPIFVLNLEIH